MNEFLNEFLRDWLKLGHPLQEQLSNQKYKKLILNVKRLTAKISEKRETHFDRLQLVELLVKVLQLDAVKKAKLTEICLHLKQIAELRNILAHHTARPFMENKSGWWTVDKLTKNNQTITYYLTFDFLHAISADLDRIPTMLTYLAQPDLFADADAKGHFDYLKKPFVLFAPRDLTNRPDHPIDGVRYPHIII